MCYIFLLTVLFALAYLYYKRRVLSQKFFAYFLNSFSQSYNKGTDAEKQELFSDLIELDQNVRKTGGITKILEVGVGSGANLKYLPKEPFRLSCVDPNPYFQDYFEQNKEHGFSHINLEKWQVGYGEDLGGFPDSTFDAVVVTLVLCSVSDVNKVLSEVRRVLKPGGKFYFMEHVHDKPGTRRHRIQNLLTPIWRTLFEGCELNRNIGQAIRNAGFGQVNLIDFEAKLGNWSVLVGSHVRGNAVK